jgi:hypothetical protein
MDGEAFKESVQLVVQSYVAAQDNRAILLHDNFSVHMQHDNKTALQQLGVEV